MQITNNLIQEKVPWQFQQQIGTGAVTLLPPIILNWEE